MNWKKRKTFFFLIFWKIFDYGLFWFHLFSEASAEILKKFHVFFVDMKTSKGRFEINWPLHSFVYYHFYWIRYYCILANIKCLAWNSTTCADISRKFIFIPLLTTSHHKWSHMLCSTIHITYIHMSCDGSEITMFGGPCLGPKEWKDMQNVFAHCHFITMNLNDKGTL